MGARDEERAESFVDEDEELYRREVGGLMSVATTLVGPDDAADVVADAVVRTMTSPSWSRARNRRAYLYRSVINEAKMLVRARDRRRLREHVEAVTSVIRNEMATPRPDVHVAVAGLSVNQRAVVHLVYWEDLSVAATAELLGISEGTVKRHLFRARAHLRGVLDA